MSLVQPNYWQCSFGSQNCLGFWMTGHTSTLVIESISLRQYFCCEADFKRMTSKYPLPPSHSLRKELSTYFLNEHFPRGLAMPFLWALIWQSQNLLELVRPFLNEKSYLLSLWVCETVWDSSLKYLCSRSQGVLARKSTQIHHPHCGNRWTCLWPMAPQQSPYVHTFALALSSLNMFFSDMCPMSILKQKCQYPCLWNGKWGLRGYCEETKCSSHIQRTVSGPRITI